jgi:hypothetical protein
MKNQMNDPEGSGLANPFSPKLQLFTAIAAAVDSCRDEIFATKQPLPWAGDRNGPVYVVTTRQVTGSMEHLFLELRNLVASASIDSFSLPQSISGGLDSK